MPLPFLFFVALFLSLSAILRADEFVIRLPVLPTEIAAVSKANQNDAEEIFQRAVEAAKNKMGYDAMQLVLAALEKNPHHEAIRRQLGFTRYENSWRTTWELNKLKAGFIDHPRFGWIRDNHRERYESGERFYTGKTIGGKKNNSWVSQTDDATLRNAIDNGWEIQTEHYDLRTNLGLEEGVKTARELEHFYRAWKLLLFRYLFLDDELTRLFEGKNVTGRLARHRVLLFREKSDYLDYLSQIETDSVFLTQSTGYYLPSKKTAFFFPVFADADERDAEHIRQSLFHEAGHQLFQESRFTTDKPGRKSNYWLLEGIAMFLETYRIEDEYYLFGDPNHERIQIARIYWERTTGNEPNGFFVPFKEIAALGQESFLADRTKAVRMYSQSAGMTYFLMVADNGRYRNAVQQLLRQIYIGSDHPDSLQRLTGKSFAELEKEYQAFLSTINK